jgi:hypothetical protein
MTRCNEPDGHDRGNSRPVASLASIGSAYADSEGGTNANTFFTQLPGVVAKAPVQNVPPSVTTQNGRAVQTYMTQSSHGTWLFPPHSNEGNNN